MKKMPLKILLLLFFIIYFSFFTNRRVFAANAYVTGCLEIVETLTDISIDGKTDHVAKVRGGGFPVGKDIYIVGCISTPEGIKCTSGNSEINTKLNEIGFSTNPFPGHEFKAINNPFKSQDGSVEVILRSATPKGEDHSFFGIAQVVQEEYRGEARTITYGTFGFSDDPKKCIGIRWDPKGRVFDSESLEPLPQTTVALLDSNKNKVNLTGVENPVTTRRDGLFNFFVPDGIYYLSFEKNSYQHPLLLSEVNPKYQQIYYCDREVGQPLYYDQFEIKEKGKLIHCDVPLKPLGTPYIAPEVVLMDYGQIRLGPVTKIYGTFSHPLTKVQIKKEDGLLIKEIVADKNGGWTYFVDNSQMPVTVVGLKNNAVYQQAKNGLIDKIISLIFKSVFSQTATFTFHPILTYIEGYAFDSKGEIIPRAIINVVPEMTKKTYYSTFADEKGFFKIETDKLPIFPYYIQIINPNKRNLVNNITTTAFLKNNEKYLQEKKLNLLTAQVVSTGSSQMIKKNTPSPTKDKGFNFGEKGGINKLVSPTSQVMSKSLTNNSFLLIVVMILLILLASVFIVYYFYTRKKISQTSL